MSSPDDGPCGGIFLLVFGIALLFSGLQRFLLYQKVKNTATSKVRSAAVGLVELFGKVVRKEKTISPITKTKCGYWRITAEWFKSGKHGGWRRFYTAGSTDLFYLEDETGKMLVNPKDAEVDIPRDHLFKGYIAGKGIFGMPHKKIDPKILSFIDAQDASVKKKFMDHRNHSVRVHEYYIAEGDPVYVLGRAHALDDKSSHVAHENLVIKKGKYEKIMYISDTSEKKIIEKMKNHALWFTFGGLALAAIGLFIILNSMNL